MPKAPECDDPRLRIGPVFSLPSTSVQKLMDAVNQRCHLYLYLSTRKDEGCLCSFRKSAESQIGKASEVTHRPRLPVNVYRACGERGPGEKCRGRDEID